MFDEAIIERIAQRTAELVRGVTVAPILTRAEAMKYVRRSSHAAFSEWCSKWHVRAEGRGRWSKARLDLALAREAGTAHVPANLRKTF
jgi:hypothetical protein